MGRVRFGLKKGTAADRRRGGVVVVTRHWSGSGPPSSSTLRTTIERTERVRRPRGGESEARACRGHFGPSFRHRERRGQASAGRQDGSGLLSTIAVSFCSDFFSEVPSRGRVLSLLPGETVRLGQV
eukprot:764240-Hanusia_phi.AAC.11